MRSRAGLSLLVVVSVMPIGCGDGDERLSVNPERTVCFAGFNSRGAADDAAAAGEAAGFAVLTERRRPDFIALTFETDEIDREAVPLRRVFRRIVTERDGRFLHPGGGCLQKPYLD